MNRNGYLPERGDIVLVGSDPHEWAFTGHADETEASYLMSRSQTGENGWPRITQLQVPVGAVSIRLLRKGRPLPLEIFGNVKIRELTEDECREYGF